MKLTIFTPTYSGDYERFCLQRESFRRCHITLPQVAVVLQQDWLQFADVPDRINLTILKAEDVLPIQVIRRLDLWGLRRWNPKRWWKGLPLKGWHLQQFIKLASAEVVQTDGIVCMDSDSLFIRHVDESDFCTADGRLHLYETSEIDAEIAEWIAIAMRFLGVNLQKLPVTNFTHAPTILHREIVRDMLKLIEQRHGRKWYDIFDPLRLRTMEYSLYGVFAKYVDQLSRVTSVEPTISACYWWTEQVREIADTFARRTACPEVKIAHIQSNAKMSPAVYRGLVEAAWSRFDDESTLTSSAPPKSSNED